MLNPINMAKFPQQQNLVYSESQSKVLNLKTMSRNHKNLKKGSKLTKSYMVKSSATLQDLEKFKIA